MDTPSVLGQADGFEIADEIRCFEDESICFIPLEGNAGRATSVTVTQVAQQGSYPITPGDETTHPLGRSSEPSFSKPGETQTTKMLAMEISRQDRFHTDARIARRFAPPPLSKKSASRFARAGVLLCVLCIRLLPPMDPNRLLVGHM